MARWSDIAQWVGPTPNQSGPMQEYRGLVLHIMQGSYAGSIAWGKNPASNVSFHFATAKDGRCGQLVDTGITAWTQGSGNGHWLSVENEDFNTNPLSPPQLEKVAQIYARGVQTYGWPLQSTDSPSGRGLGWHGMGGAAWGGHYTCPGEPIKAQRPAILARASQILGLTPAPTTVEDGMFTLKGAGPQRYLVDGRDLETGKPIACPISDAAYADYAAAGIRSAVVNFVNPDFYAIMTPPLPGGTTVTLTPEQVAQIAAAAQAGAEAGAPTQAELVEAAREGSEIASDS